MDPENIAAVCVAGHCALAKRDTQAASAHAAWALQLDPMDERALTLLTATKARKSLLLGLWWRFQSFIAAGSRLRTVSLLIGFYLLFRVLLIMLDDFGKQGWTAAVSVVWLCFCAYTWIAPQLFWKAVRK